MTRYRNVRRPRDEEDRRALKRLAGDMLSRAFEGEWRVRPACLVAAVAYARRSNERCA